MSAECGVDGAAGGSHVDVAVGKSRVARSVDGSGGCAGRGDGSADDVATALPSPARNGTLREMEKRSLICSTVI